MRPSKYPLSKSDFESGRFDLLADFVRNNWPFGGVLTQHQSRETVAKTLGYEDYKDALASSTAVAHSPSIGYFDLEGNFDKLNIDQSGLELSSDEDHPSDGGEGESPDQYLKYLISRFDSPSKKFLDSWPLDLVGRWNYEKNGCTFSVDFMKGLEPEFEKIWSNSELRHNTFVSSLENTNSAASFIIQETLDNDIDTLSSLSIRDILDPELCEALLQDSMPKLISEVVTVSSCGAEILVRETGISLADIWALPKTEEGFPSLYEHMRKYLFDVVLEKRLISLFIKDRDENGFYIPQHDYYDDLEEKPAFPNEVNFVFHQHRDEMDCEDFRSYSWSTEARSRNGDLLAKAVGSYIHGPANRPTSGSDLIFSLDQVGDYDVEIVDMIQTVLQHDILEADDELIEKGCLNMQLLFRFGNLLTVTHWERSGNTEPGLGLQLLTHTIDVLKRRFRRNMHVAAILSASQYTSDGQIHPVVRERRHKDIGKIANNFSQLGLHLSVLRVFASMRQIEEGPGAFVRHCGEAYIRHHGVDFDE